MTKYSMFKTAALMKEASQWRLKILFMEDDPHALTKLAANEDFNDFMQDFDEYLKQGEDGSLFNRVNEWNRKVFSTSGFIKMIKAWLKYNGIKNVTIKPPVDKFDAAFFKDFADNLDKYLQATKIDPDRTWTKVFPMMPWREKALALDDILMEKKSVTLNEDDKATYEDCKNDPIFDKWLRTIGFASSNIPLAYTYGAYLQSGIWTRLKDYTLDEVNAMGYDANQPLPKDYQYPYMTVVNLPNGKAEPHYLVTLVSVDQLHQEGEQMNNCLAPKHDEHGEGGHEDKRFRDGSVTIYSLRDMNNNPRLSVRKKDDRVDQCYGTNNMRALSCYYPGVREWIDENGFAFKGRRVHGYKEMGDIVDKAYDKGDIDDDDTRSYLEALERGFDSNQTKWNAELFEMIYDAATKGKYLPMAKEMLSAMFSMVGYTTRDNASKTEQYLKDNEFDVIYDILKNLQSKPYAEEVKKHMANNLFVKDMATTLSRMPKDIDATVGINVLKDFYDMVITAWLEYFLMCIRTRYGSRYFGSDIGLARLMGGIGDRPQSAKAFQPNLFTSRLVFGVVNEMSKATLNGTHIPTYWVEDSEKLLSEYDEISKVISGYADTTEKSLGELADTRKWLVTKLQSLIDEAFEDDTTFYMDKALTDAAINDPGVYAKRKEDYIVSNEGYRSIGLDKTTKFYSETQVPLEHTQEIIGKMVSDAASLRNSPCRENDYYAKNLEASIKQILSNPLRYKEVSNADEILRSLNEKPADRQMTLNNEVDYVPFKTETPQPKPTKTAPRLDGQMSLSTEGPNY